VVKVRHDTMRSCPISFRGKIYQVDGDGCVEVPDDQVSMILAGAAWRKVGSSKPAAAQPTRDVNTPAETPTQDMTKAELLELAQGMGLEVDAKVSKLKLASVIREAKKER
jgi:hypothetical protein